MTDDVGRSDEFRETLAEAAAAAADDPSYNPATCIVPEEQPDSETAGGLAAEDEPLPAETWQAALGLHPEVRAAVAAEVARQRRLNRRAGGKP
jgi:hypothetical protein